MWRICSAAGTSSDSKSESARRPAETAADSRECPGHIAGVPVHRCLLSLLAPCAGARLAAHGACDGGRARPPRSDALDAAQAASEPVTRCDSGTGADPADPADQVRVALRPGRAARGRQFLPGLAGAGRRAVRLRRRDRLHVDDGHIAQVIKRGDFPGVCVLDERLQQLVVEVMA